MPLATGPPRPAGSSSSASFPRARQLLPRHRDAQAPASAGSGSHRPLVLAEHDDAVDDVDAEGEDAERPPRVGAADRQQGRDRAEAAADDPDDPAVGVAGHQRESAAELNHTEDDQYPAEGVEVGQYVPL